MEQCIEVFSYDKTDFNISILNESEDSKFDLILKKRWHIIEEDNVLRYSVKTQQSKILPGKYRFYAQVKRFTQ